MENTLILVDEYYKRMIDSALDKIYDKQKYIVIGGKEYITAADLCCIIEQLGDEIYRLNEEIESDKWRN